jgi:hypothetical protein
MTQLLLVTTLLNALLAEVFGTAGTDQGLWRQTADDLPSTGLGITCCFSVICSLDGAPAQDPAINTILSTSEKRDSSASSQTRWGAPSLGSSPSLRPWRAMLRPARKTWSREAPAGASQDQAGQSAPNQTSPVPWIAPAWAMGRSHLSAQKTRRSWSGRCGDVPQHFQ